MKGDHPRRLSISRHLCSGRDRHRHRGAPQGPETLLGVSGPLHARAPIPGPHDTGLSGRRCRAEFGRPGVPLRRRHRRVGTTRAGARAALAFRGPARPPQPSPGTGVLRSQGTPWTVANQPHARAPSPSRPLHEGAHALVRDPKRNSHPWAKALPTVCHRRNVAGLHDALTGLATEPQRRRDPAVAPGAPRQVSRTDRDGNR